MEIKNPFETIKSEKIKLGRFNVVQDEVRVNGNVRPYDYLEMLEGGQYTSVPFLLLFTRVYLGRMRIRPWKRKRLTCCIL